MNIEIDQQTAERAAKALRDQARHKEQAYEAACQTVPGGLIADPAIVARHIWEEHERLVIAAQEIERAMGYDDET